MHCLKDGQPEGVELHLRGSWTPNFGLNRSGAMLPFTDLHVAKLLDARTSKYDPMPCFPHPGCDLRNNVKPTVALTHCPMYGVGPNLNE
jgi:hypothetical protein